jgi:hypothetical protein
MQEVTHILGKKNKEKYDPVVERFHGIEAVGRKIRGQT